MSDANKPSPLFSDVLGAMVSGIAQARRIADVAAVNLAYEYQRHDLLKGMAVPRLRFRSVDVSLPVLIRQVYPAKNPELHDAARIAGFVADEVQRRVKLVSQKIRFEAHEDASRKQREFQESVAALWDVVAHDHSIKLLRGHVESQIEQRVTKQYAISGASPASASEAAIRAEVAASVRSGFRLLFRDILGSPAEPQPQEDAGDQETPTPKRPAMPKFSELQRTVLYGEVLASAARLASDACFRAPSVPAELELAVCTDEIKNTGGGADSVTRIRFSLLEEGLEWVEDEHGSRLMVE